MNKYYYQLINGEKIGFKNIEEAKTYADSSIAYNPDFEPVIENQKGEEVARRRWVGTALKNEPEYVEFDDPITFGNYGYYTDWIDLI